jgi:hypothetical protein
VDLLIDQFFIILTSDLESSDTKFPAAFPINFFEILNNNIEELNPCGVVAILLIFIFPRFYRGLRHGGHCSEKLDHFVVVILSQLYDDHP